ncbi:lysostaphin resistance A-like protein [Actinophytocola sp.]|uniref:CPBP family intramembrane glutamic endopeptidase n=1 Tax=Actinophytocola sp. TaxID=1872138 RepID=UPI00389A12DF
MTPTDTNTRWPAAVRLVVLLVVFFGADLLIGLVVPATTGAPFWCLVVGVVFAALVLLLYTGAVRFTERREVVELRRADAPGGLLRGAGVGLALFVAVIALIAVFGGYRITGGGSVWDAVAALGVMCAVAVAEELLFRGVLLRILEQLIGTKAALGISAVVFGGVHLLNPKATVWGAVAIAAEAGLMLGAAYVATRTLWVPIGIHFAWNFAETGIFGATASGGRTVSHSLLHSTMPGSTLITGGEFGPEASVFAILVSAVPIVLFLRAARRRGRVLPRRTR